MRSKNPEPSSECAGIVDKNDTSCLGSKFCYKQSGREQCISSAPAPTKVQVKIIRGACADTAPADRLQRARLSRLPSSPPAASAAADLRLTVDVGRADVTLRHGSKHGYKVVREQRDPSPLHFSPENKKLLVPEQECRKHYISFSCKGGVVRKTWICSICGGEWPKQYALMRHLLVDHLNVRTFRCQTCQKAFKTREVLTQHMASHSKLKPYVCAVCQKRFGRVSTLIQHKRLHSDYKPFSCHCGKTFHQKVNLTVHQRVHRPAGGSGSRPSCRRQSPPVHSCPVCSDRLPTLQALADHKLKCQPPTAVRRESARTDGEERSATGNKRDVNGQLLNKIQSIVQNQERLRGLSGGGSWPQRQSAAVPPPATGKLCGVLTVGPIRTRSMQLARERKLQPFVLLQGDGEEPILAKVLGTADRRELLVPATTDDLRALQRQQTADGNSGKLDLPVVAIVTQYRDALGSWVRIQPPSCEESDGAGLCTSQIDLSGTRGTLGSMALNTNNVPLGVPTSGGVHLVSPVPTGLPTSTGQLPIPAGQLPTSALQLPTSAGQLPTSAGQLPISAGQLPTSAGQLLNSAGQLPTSAGQLLNSAGQLTSSAGQLLNSAGRLPTTAGQPSTSVDQLSTGQPSNFTGQLPTSAGQLSPFTRPSSNCTGLLPTSPGQLSNSAGYLLTPAGQLSTTIGQLACSADQL